MDEVILDLCNGFMLTEDECGHVYSISEGLSVKEFHSEGGHGSTTINTVEEEECL
jgi:hypothetical protein